MKEQIKIIIAGIMFCYASIVFLVDIIQGVFYLNVLNCTYAIYTIAELIGMIAMFYTWQILRRSAKRR
jgi:hypothetical protein